MKRSHLIIFIGGALVAAGMVISFYGSVLTTQDLTIAEGPVNTSSPLQVTKDLDPSIATVGAFVVHAENFEQDTLQATVFDPSGDQMMSKKINDKTTEEQFEIKSKGTYKMILENSGAEVSATIGLIHMPDKSILAINVLGQGIIISGFVGVGVAIIYEIKSRRKTS